MIKILAGAAALALLATAAQAQMAAQQAAPPAPTVVRGKVTALAADAITVKTDKGADQKVGLTPTWTVAVMKPVAIDAIQAGSFIGTTNMPKGDGKGSALEVHVFPPGVKLGEGHYGWDLKPGSMMTNGTVGKVVAGKKGSRELDVAYNGSGQRHIVVPANVPVVQITGGTRDLVKVGTPVFMVVRKNADGTMATNSVSVGENGAKPPM